MSEKIKVGNAEIEKVNYDYFSLQYSKMPKEYVIADLVSKCEDYEKLGNAYEKLEVEKIQKENIIKEVRKCIKRKDICIDTRKTDGSMDYVDLEKELLEILDKVD